MLVVDQFEELFTVGVDPDSRPGILPAARRATPASGRRWSSASAPIISPGCRSTPTSPGSPNRVCTWSARWPVTSCGRRSSNRRSRPGYRLEHGLVDLFVRDTEGEPGALPLLSHALVETWRRRDGHVLTVEGYRADGRHPRRRRPLRRPALRQPARRAAADAARRSAAARHPVGRRRPGALPGATRTLRRRPGRANRSSALLVRARLVTAEADTVELAHEALARAWPRLQSWLDDDAAGQRILRHLAAAAAGWETLGRPDSELYRGARLDTAIEWSGITPIRSHRHRSGVPRCIGRPRRERTGRPGSPRPSATPTRTVDSAARSLASPCSPSPL